MATKEEKEYKAAQRQAAQQSLANERARAGASARGTLAAPKLRASGDMSRYLIGGFTDDPVAAARKQAEERNKAAAVAAKPATTKKAQPAASSTKTAAPPAKAGPPGKLSAVSSGRIAKTPRKIPPKGLRYAKRVVSSGRVAKVPRKTPPKGIRPAKKPGAMPRKLTQQQLIRRFG